jgi:hypothetical protein
MERFASPIRELAHHLHPDEPVAKKGVLDRVFTELQRAQILRIKVDVVSLDSTHIKVHPDGTGALKKTDPRPSEDPEEGGPPKFIWLPQMLERS